MASRLKKPSASPSVTTDTVSLQGHAASSPPTSNVDGGTRQRRRSSELTINPSTMSVAQPPENSEEPDQQGLTRSTSSVTLDGEPRLFPGLVSSRSRRRSGRTSLVEEGDGVGGGSRAKFRGGGGGEADVVEEGESGEE